MPITDKVTLFGYSALEVEQYIAEINEDFEKKKEELEKTIADLKQELEQLKEQVEQQKKNKKVIVKKRLIPAQVQDQPQQQSDQLSIMQTLYDAHIQATEKINKVQRNITMTLEKRKSLIILREKKSKEMKKDLQNLISYVDSVAKDY